MSLHKILRRWASINCFPQKALFYSQGSYVLSKISCYSIFRQYIRQLIENKIVCKKSKIMTSCSSLTFKMNLTQSKKLNLFDDRIWWPGGWISQGLKVVQLATLTVLLLANGNRIRYWMLNELLFLNNLNKSFFQSSQPGSNLKWYCG